MSDITEDRNQPVKKACPHCGDINAKLMPPAGDYDKYQCPKCGIYKISGSNIKRIKKGDLNPKTADFHGEGDSRFLS